MLNPIVRREARVALRSWRLFASITAYITVVTMFIGVLLYNMSYNSYDFSFDPMNMLVIYCLVVSMQFGLVIIATPALTAGSISGERERQTLDLLLVTRMSAGTIVIGKLIASLSQLLLILAATLPAFAVVFYFGGTSIGGFITAMGYIFLTACMAGAISLFFSCIFKRTVVSILLVYIIFGILCLGTLIAVFIYQFTYYSNYQAEPSIWVAIILLALNPAAGFVSVLCEQTGSNVVDLFSFGGNILTDTQIWILDHFYLICIVVQIVITVFFLWQAARCIYPNKRHKNRG